MHVLPSIYDIVVYMLYADGSEYATPTAMPVLEGECPKHVDGVLYRCGPNTFDVKCKNGKTFTFRHWWDSYVMWVSMVGYDTGSSQPVATGRVRSGLVGTGSGVRVRS
eukprot:GHVU01087114.1.p1 GENE.GHVU01087114.1~~GHVU01087114.1.p1  ORF type:complete len:108 (-),score=9.01 GHVU01087114.1:543-866(-)